MTFNKRKYNATRKQVLKFLENNPDADQSIALLGDAGSGKSRMLNELLPDFENNGYECLEGIQSPTRITRSISGKKVFAWKNTTDSVDLKQDNRFVVFNF